MHWLSALAMMREVRPGPGLRLVGICGRPPAASGQVKDGAPAVEEEAELAPTNMG